jgi:hypothetical protein
VHTLIIDCRRNARLGLKRLKPQIVEIYLNLDHYSLKALKSSESKQLFVNTVHTSLELLEDTLGFVKPLSCLVIKLDATDKLT